MKRSDTCQEEVRMRRFTFLLLIALNLLLIGMAVRESVTAELTFPPVDYKDVTGPSYN